MKSVLLTVLIFTGTNLLAQPVELKKTKISDDISIELPTRFSPLTNQEINQKFISYRKPLAVYGDEARVVDFGVNVSFTSWGNEDLSLMKQFFKSSILNLYDTVVMLNEGMEEINGVQYAVFEFVSSVRGEENSFVHDDTISKYTYLQYALVNGKTLLFNISCPARARGKWAPVAHEMMHSIKIKKSF